MTLRVLLLVLAMIDSFVCSSAQSVIIDTNNNQSFPLHNNVRDVFEEGTFSAGNTKCWHSNKCGKHEGKSYSWCYTDEYKKVEEKCCTGECTLHTMLIEDKKHKFYSCYSGEEFADCGSPGPRTVAGTNCLTSHPCGTHGYKYYWCYVDENKSWEYCCHPLSNCASKGVPNNHWCNVDFYYVPKWKPCVP